MERSWEKLKEKALPYAREAFERYGEKMFTALWVLYDCSYKVREKGLLALEETAEQWEEEMRLGKSNSADVPLKKLLVYGMRKLADSSDEDCLTEEIIKKAEAYGYFGYEWYVVYLYLGGIRGILASEFPESFELKLRMMVPEQWLEEYDRYSQIFVQKRQAEKEAGVREQFREAVSARTAFHRRFQEMEPEKIRYILKELDYKTLAAGIVFAEEPLRNRFLENMTERQRRFVIEEWYGRKRIDEYSPHESLAAMYRMMMIAGLSG